ncbi:MAG: hypothetical protein MUF87_07000 [Anaerolineae bacterium]|jgi:hypothetical protein|nr:hypothetical protein [Anaerolineae bacterium]
MTYYDKFDDQDDLESDDQPLGVMPAWKRALLIVVTLLVIFALLATSYLPAVIVTQERARLPTPTTLPRT